MSQERVHLLIGLEHAFQLMYFLEHRIFDMRSQNVGKGIYFDSNLSLSGTSCTVSSSLGSI